jgi:transcriptional regulator with XRE-family HTH domain
LLRAYRKEAGLTQVQLAEKLGIDQSLVSKIECNERLLDIIELRCICIALGTNLQDFISRYEAMPQANVISEKSNDKF